jgi:hypothetical protein
MLAVAPRRSELASPHGRTSDMVTSPAKCSFGTPRICTLDKASSDRDYLQPQPRPFHLSPKLTYVFPEDLCW